MPREFDPFVWSVIRFPGYNARAHLLKRKQDPHPPMSYEEQASSWALSLFDTLESSANIKTRILAAAGAGLITSAIWIGHLLNPDVFAYFLQVDGWSKLVLGFLLAPPFVLAFIVGSFVYPQPDQPKTRDEVGPMSTYFYQERSSRRWKLLIAAGLVAAVNFVLMLVTSGL